jgi:hypothetical protein
MPVEVNMYRLTIAPLKGERVPIHGNNLNKFENSVLSVISGPKKDEVTEESLNYIMRNLMI